MPNSRDTVQADDDHASNSAFSRDADGHTDGDLSQIIAELKRTALTPAQYAYLLQRKKQDERATWLLQFIRQHAPWVLTMLGSIVTAIYFALTHTFTIEPKS